MRNKKYSIPDCVAECEILSGTEAVARLKLIKERLKQEWNSCQPGDLPEVDRLLTFVELAIYHISTDDNKFDTGASPDIEELECLCNSVLQRCN